MSRLLIAFVLCTFPTALLHAQCEKGQDHRSRGTSGLLVMDFSISGTQTLSSVELARITSEVTGSCFDEDSSELEERIRELFQNKGYFDAVVENLSIKPSDPLATPKPVSLEAVVVEGPRYKVGKINFSGNHLFSTAKLRSRFSLKKGDWFERNEIAGALEGIRKFYASEGFIDFMAIPDTQKLSNATILLTLAITEGSQYHMGKLEVFAKKELADKLQAEWQLPEGAVFDFTYLDKYVGSVRPLLPPEFNERDLQLVRNCREASVEVRLPLDGTDPRSQSLPTDTGCKPPARQNNSPEN